METYFGGKLRELREKHFPGESLRKVSEKLDLGDNFYSYLSKIELSTSLPSEDFLDKIYQAYGLSDKEYDELVELYYHDKIKFSLNNLEIETKEAPQALRQYLRSVKKKVDEDENKPTQKL